MSHIHINFEHVNYSYEKSVPILQDITFTAHENDSIGLIGANGVGKSTLLKLLVGLNLDYEGSIRVEEMPVVKEMLPKVREKSATSSRIPTVSFSCRRYLRMLHLLREIMGCRRKRWKNV